MELEPVIGLEIHVQLTTKSKMFCRCANIFPAAAGPPANGGVVVTEANTAICPICLGYPGTLPVPNQQAIAWTQKVGAALTCELATHSRFDRKHYFYPDLPKGYQISQYDKPFCGKGYLTIVVDGQTRTIGITRIHLEEDAAKNIHPVRSKASNGAGPERKTDYTLIDFNRAGTPLIEIVTEPDIRTPQEAKMFLQELQRIMRTLGVSTADMEKGQMRADANISLRPVGEKKFYPKTEIKNVNSFRFVEKALQYEIKRQGKLWQQGQTPPHATRGWSLTTGKTVAQRTKEEAADYRYFPEPDIPPFEFSPDELGEIKRRLPELPLAKKERLKIQTGINEGHAQLLVDDPALAQLFEDTVSELAELNQEHVGVADSEMPTLVKLAATMMVREVRQLFAEQNLRYPDAATKLSAENIAELVVLLQQQKISRAGIPKVLAAMQKTGGDPHPLIQKLGLAQEVDTSKLEAYVEQVVAAHPDVVAKIKAGKGAAIQFLMGQIMAKSEGKFSPKQIIELLNNKIHRNE